MILSEILPTSSTPFTKEKYKPTNGGQIAIERLSRKKIKKERRLDFYMQKLLTREGIGPQSWRLMALITTLPGICTVFSHNRFHLSKELNF